MADPDPEPLRVPVPFRGENGNPNGDPDAGNAPRLDPGDRARPGLRRLPQAQDPQLRPDRPRQRDAVRHLRRARDQPEPPHRPGTQGDRRPSDAKKGASKGEGGSSGKQWMCQTFFDVRAFGAVMSTGANAGQVRGPVQIAFARSVDPVLSLELSITRMAVAENVEGASPRPRSPSGRSTSRKTSSAPWGESRSSPTACSWAKASSAPIWPRRPASPKRTWPCSGKLCSTCTSTTTLRPARG